MDRVESPTEELLRGIAKALEAEAAELEAGHTRKTLRFLRDSVEDAVESISGTDAS